MPQGKHIIMTDGTRMVVVPSNPVNLFTMAGIVIDAGLTVEELHGLL
jgi:hypothetical protein